MRDSLGGTCAFFRYSSVSFIFCTVFFHTMLICNNFITCLFLNLINISLKPCRKGGVVTDHIENVYLWLHVGDK
jgi:hypothetical protein